MKDDKSDRYVLQLRNIKKRFGDLKAVDGVSLNVRPGEVVSIIGPSGCGKSTLLRCINHLVIPEEGEIYLNDELMKASEKGIFFKSEADINRQRAKVGMVFQSFNLYPHMTALGNVSLALRKVQGLDRAEAETRAQRALDRVHLADRADHYPNQLSGGQQQRVAIARAIALEPRVMLFDEPTSALDPELVGGVLAVMRELREDGMTMVVVSHEMSFARAAADRVVFMADGEILEQGSPEQMFNAPRHERMRAFISQIERH